MQANQRHRTGCSRYPRGVGTFISARGTERRACHNLNTERRDNANESVCLCVREGGGEGSKEGKGHERANQPADITTAVAQATFFSRVGGMRGTWRRRRLAPICSSRR